MNKTTLFFFIIIFQTTYSQNKFNIEALSGFGLNKELSLINEEVKGYSIFTIQVNTNYQFRVYNRIFMESGIGAQWYFSRGNIASFQFNSTSLRLNIPIIMGIRFLKKFSLGSGISIGSTTICGGK